jgi:hypothetical protein
MDQTLIVPPDAREPYRRDTRPEQEMSLEFSNRVRQFAAWVVIVLLIAVPAWILLSHVTSGIACFVWWAVASIWAGLYAVRLATHAVPGQYKTHFAVTMAALALVNLLFSLVAMVWPGFTS